MKILAVFFFAFLFLPLSAIAQSGVVPTLVGEIDLGIGRAKTLKVWGNDYIYGKTDNDLFSTLGLVSREGTSFWSHGFDSSNYYINSLVVNNDIIVFTLQDTIYMVDKQGVVLKRKKVPTTYSGPYSGISLHKGENGRYIAHEGDYGSSVIRWFVYDENLNHLSTHEGVHPGGIRRIIQDQDNNYLVASSQYGGGVHTNRSINFDKYDTSGTLIWTTKIPDAIGADLVLVNGRLYFSCMFVRQSAPTMVTRYGELSLETGDTLWTRQWIAEGFPMGVESIASPYNSFSSSDGGFVIVGQSTKPGQNNPNYNIATALIITSEGDVSSVILDSQSNIFIDGDWNENKELVLAGSGGASNSSKLVFYHIPGITVGVDGEEEGSIPGDFTLSQNYPNPFNPSTTISYTLPQSGEVLLKVFDILGKEVAILVDGYQEAGSHRIDFHASNLPSGVYIYQLRAGNFVSNKKMMLMK